MTGAFIVGWYLAMYFNNGGAITTQQFGPFIDKQACEQASKEIKQQFGVIITKSVCVPSGGN